MSDTVIINVKGIRKNTWNAATQAASLRKELYGPYLSDALDLRLRFDAGEVKLPGEQRNQAANPPLTEDQRTARIAALAELAKGIAAVRLQTGRATGITMLSAELAALMVKPASTMRLSRHKDTGLFGQSDKMPIEADLSEQGNYAQLE
jgi:hypothetical protein